MGKKKIVWIPTLIYRINVIPIEIPACYFVHIDKLILKFIQRGKRFIIANTISKENNKVRVPTLPTSRLTIKLQ